MINCYQSSGVQSGRFAQHICDYTSQDVSSASYAKPPVHSLFQYTIPGIQVKICTLALHPCSEALGNLCRQLEVSQYQQWNEPYTPKVHHGVSEIDTCNTITDGCCPRKHVLTCLSADNGSLKSDLGSTVKADVHLEKEKLNRTH